MHSMPVKKILSFVRRTLCLGGFAFVFLPVVCGAAEPVRQAYEEKVASNVQRVLEGIVGVGQVKVTVHADMNTSVLKVNEDVLKAEEPLLKRNKKTIVSTEEEFIYASKNVEHIEQSENIRNLAIVVVATQRAFRRLNTPEVYQLIERISGFSSGRGDTIDMTPTLESLSGTMNYSGWICALVLLLLGTLVWRLSGRRKMLPAKVTLPDFARPEVMAEFSPENEKLVKKTRRFLDEEPEESLSVLRQWMYQKGNAHE